jgi:putative FmdB family regulatory protein
MPTYEYRCVKGHTFDVFQKMSEEPIASCPDCGEGAQRVVSGGVGFLFKGEGFYITDSRSPEYKKKAEAERGGSPDAAPAKTSGSTETKRAGKNGEGKGSETKGSATPPSTGSKPPASEG